MKNQILKKLSLLILGILIIFFMGCSGKKIKTSNEKTSLDKSKSMAIAQVHKAASEISEGLKNIKDVKERINFIRNYIDPIRFYEDKSGYFYVYDYTCINIAHAIQKDIQGKNLCNHKDTKGKFVIRELSAKAQNGGGYVDFYWVKPGATGEKKKLGYVEPIPGTDYFIGSGVYLPEN